jgi:hypothetical protein
MNQMTGTEYKSQQNPNREEQAVMFMYLNLKTLHKRVLK